MIRRMNEHEVRKSEKGRRLPARLILWGMGFLSFFRLPRRLIEEHLSHNRRVWESIPNKSFIEDQTRLTDFMYGRERKWLGKKLLGGRPLRAAENACEVIAVYNALLALGEKPDFPDLLGQFERRGISLMGYFGTSFKGVWRFFAKSPYLLRVLRGGQITREILENLQAEGYGVCVMMAENKAGDLKEMVHTICITKKDAATWTAHNDYEGSKTYEGLPEAVFGYHKGGGRPLGLLLLKAR